jgi:hypothetical protein
LTGAECPSKRVLIRLLARSQIATLLGHCPPPKPSRPGQTLPRGPNSIPGAWPAIPRLAVPRAGSSDRRPPKLKSCCRARRRANAPPPPVPSGRCAFPPCPSPREGARLGQGLGCHAMPLTRLHDESWRS